MDSPAKKDRPTPSPDSPPSVGPGGSEVDVDAEELRFFRQMAKVARRTTAREIDRLFRPAD